MSFQSKTLSLALKGCKWGYLGFQRKRLEPRVLPWQQNGRGHSVSFMMYIIGAKFEDQCFNISGDIFDSVFYYLCGTIYDIITFLICIMQKREYLWNRKRYSKKESAIRLDSENPFKKAAIIFYFIGTLRTLCWQTSWQHSGWQHFQRIINSSSFIPYM